MTNTFTFLLGKLRSPHASRQLSPHAITTEHLTQSLTPQLERNMPAATKQAFVLQLRPNTPKVKKERNQCFFKNHKTDNSNFTLIPSLID